MNSIKSFVKSYSGKKLAILAAGGGCSLAMIAAIPGASRVLHSFYSPYETSESLRFLRDNHPGTPTAFAASAVSAGAAMELYEAMANRYPDVDILVVSAACTALRWRRGDNRAFLACKNSQGVVEVWHLKIPKATEEEYRAFSSEDLIAIRRMEDEGICNVALLIASHVTNNLEGLKSDGTLSLCNP